MSNIDWSRPLEAYHPVHGACDVKVEYQHQRDGCYIVYGEEMHGSCPAGFMPDGRAYVGASNSEKEWKVRNKAEPKADAFDVAFKEDNTDIPQWAWDRMKAEYIDNDGMAASFARYIMTKEEPPVDPDLIEAREVVCGYHHDKHPESPWHIGQAEMVRSGNFDNMLDVQAAYHGIKRGRELERGEVK